MYIVSQNNLICYNTSKNKGNCNAVSVEASRSIIQKLDLDGYIDQFSKFLAREKPVAMQGDINQHYRYVKTLSNAEFPLPKPVPNLDRQLNLIKKQATLGLDDLFAFVTMIGYFNRLKAQTFQEPVSSWLYSIEIPDEIKEVLELFTDDGEINPGAMKNSFP